MYWRGVVYLGSVVVYSHPVNDRGGVELMRMRRSIALFSLSLPFPHSSHTLSHSGGAEGDVMRTSAVASRFLIANLPNTAAPPIIFPVPENPAPDFPEQEDFSRGTFTWKLSIIPLQSFFGGP